MALSQDGASLITSRWRPSQQSTIEVLNLVPFRPDLSMMVASSGIWRIHTLRSSRSLTHRNCSILHISAPFIELARNQIHVFRG